MRLVVIGASGLIGGALYRAAKAAGHAVIGTGHGRAGGNGLVRYDMRAAPLRTVVPDLGPGDVVYLLAAYISPSWIFAHGDEARALNLDATRRAIDETAEAGARLVFMSTDQVFDGARGGYGEDDAPAPLNLYGRMKAEIEDYLGRGGGDTVVARTGWTVGWDGLSHCAVKQTYEALLRPGARMAGDNVINVSDVDDIARGLLRLAEPVPGRLYHLAANPGIGRAQLAEAIRAASARGAQMAYDVVAFAEIDYTEGRPRRAWLANDRARAELGLAFTPPEAVIRRKTERLDSWHQAGDSR